MWMPRVAGSYRWNERTVLKGGYGLYYDTLNATSYGANTGGYSVTTTNVSSNDFGLTWALGNPKAGILPLADPFPVRANGSRYDASVGNTFGVDTQTGSGVTAPNLNREHPRVQRWRVGRAARADPQHRRLKWPTPGRMPIGSARPSARTTCPNVLERQQRS